MSGSGINAQQVRYIVLQNPDLVALRAAFIKLRLNDLTALETGVAAESTIKDLSFVDFLPLFFDGVNYVQVLLVTTG